MEQHEDKGSLSLHKWRLIDEARSKQRLLWWRQQLNTLPLSFVEGEGLSNFNGFCVRSQFFINTDWNNKLAQLCCWSIAVTNRGQLYFHFPLLWQREKQRHKISFTACFFTRKFGNSQCRISSVVMVCSKQPPAIRLIF